MEYPVNSFKKKFLMFNTGGFLVYYYGEYCQPKWLTFFFKLNVFHNISGTFKIIGLYVVLLNNVGVICHSFLLLVCSASCLLPSWSSLSFYCSLFHITHILPFLSKVPMFPRDGPCILS